MNKYLLCFCTFLLVANVSFGQRGSRYPKEGQFPLKPGLIMSTNVLSLFEPEGGPTLGFEVRGLHVGVAVDATALLYTMPELYRDDERHTGYRIAPQIKFYLPGRRHSYQMYISLMGVYKSVHYYKMSDGYYINNVYTDPVRYEEHKEIIAGSANFGFQKFMDEERHFLVEFYGGVGLRSKARTGMPHGEGQSVDDDYDYGGLEDGIWPHVACGIKFGYRF